MKQVNLTIEKTDIKSLERACNMVGVALVEYADEIATINYSFAYELFRLGAIYSLLKK